MIKNRIFAAIRVPYETAVLIQASLPGYDFLKNVQPQNYHITLVFLGQVDDPEGVRLKFESVLFKPFRLFVGGIGVFYKRDRPKVLYLKVKSGLEILKELHDHLKDLIGDQFDLQFPEFTPHITLCRNLKYPEFESALEIIESGFTPPYSFDVDKIYLLDSLRIDPAYLYKEISSVPLG